MDLSPSLEAHVLKPFPILLIIILSAALEAVAAESTPPGRPNILILIADDLGYADLGCQGSPDVKTPRIDSLAANGVRCTAGYVTAPLCSPSRAGLLSGRYQQRFGHEGNRNFPVMLMRGGKTIADFLKAEGYATGHFGKWHLGFEIAAYAPKEIREGNDQMLPTQHGFDESFAYSDYERLVQEGSDIRSSLRSRDDRVFARKAADFMSRHASQPWFTYVAFHAPHIRQVDYGDYRSRFPNAADDRRPLLGVMAQLDEAVGIVLDQLKQQHQEDNTLIFFLGDNGGARRSLDERKQFTGSLNTPFSGDKGTALEGGIRVPFLVQWKSRLPAGTTYDRPVSSLDILTTALAAANIVPPSPTDLDGVDLLSFLDGTKSTAPHEVLFWRWRAEQAIRMGEWKLVRGRENESWRLIDLSHDVKEENDLTSQYPDRAKDLLARFEEWNATLQPQGPLFWDAIEAQD